MGWVALHHRGTHKDKTRMVLSMIARRNWMTDAMGAEWSNPVLDFTQGGKHSSSKQTTTVQDQTNQPPGLVTLKTEKPSRSQLCDYRRSIPWRANGTTALLKSSDLHPAGEITHTPSGDKECIKAAKPSTTMYSMPPPLAPAKAQDPQFPTSHHMQCHSCHSP